VVRGARTPDALDTALERDLLGRLVVKRTSESITRYAYDPVGLLLSVKRYAPEGETLVDEIGFDYDRAGRLIAETTSIHALGCMAADIPVGEHRWRWRALPAPRRTSIRHEHDALGNVLATSLPSGPDLRYLRYGSGHLLQINLGDTVVSEMVRDDLHREISRSQGALESRFGLDAMGRRLWCRAVAKQPVEFGALGKLGKDYRYDARGLLARRHDAWLGDRQLAYDPADRIVANENDPGGAAAFQSFPTPGAGRDRFLPDERFKWDGASNALPLDGGFTVISGETVRNRVIRWQDGTYT
jgi:YD repeat-containing protein